MEEKYNDLTVKGLYYFPKLNEGLKKFQNRIPHDMLVIDGDFCSSDELEKNIIRLPNRIIILKKENKNYLPDSSPLKNKIVEIAYSELKAEWKKLTSINQENEIDYLYFLLRILWLKKFFKINANIDLNLLFLENIKEWKEYCLSDKSKFLENYFNINFDNAKIQCITFDHHSLLYKKHYKDFFEENGADIILKKDIFANYYENWDINSYLTFVFNIPPANKIEGIQKIIELSETGLTKMFIIDERIAEKALTKEVDLEGEKPYKLWQILRLRQVYVVSHLSKGSNKVSISPNIKEEAFTLEIKNDGLYFDFDSKKLENFHFLIIHKTILGNEQFKNYLNIENNDYNKWVEKIENYVPFVIIDSGRGEVDIPEKAKFLPYSYLEEVLIEKPNKYNFTKYLWRLTRYEKEEK